MQAASPGAPTIRMPRKPTRIAAKRRQPTHSPSRGPASSATISGAEEHHRHRLIEAQVLQGQEVARRRRDHQQRAQKLPAELARAKERRTAAARSAIVSISRNCPAKRTQTICTIGKSARVARYLAELSRPENSTSAMHMSPTALRRSPGRRRLVPAAQRGVCRPAAGRRCVGCVVHGAPSIEQRAAPGRGIISQRSRALGAWRRKARGPLP